MLHRMTITTRPANRNDVARLGRYQLEAYGGYADLMYADAVPGLSPLHILEMRLEQEDTSFHYAWGTIAEIDGAVAGGVHAYPADLENEDPPDPFIPSDRLPYFLPLDGLLLPGSYSVNALAVEAGYQSQGVGRALLQHVIDTATQEGFGTVSLMALEQNTAAMKLYEAVGFREHARRTTVPHPALRFAGDLLLMRLDFE